MLVLQVLDDQCEEHQTCLRRLYLLQDGGQETIRNVCMLNLSEGRYQQHSTLLQEITRHSTTTFIKWKN